ncbi:MAG TPA: molybdenum cofactor guanylyltransferase [Methanosarcinales archaeon]|nr:molybdenum cofactor guanylyltransferase [Methanosarcinales archaeon]
MRTAVILCGGRSARFGSDKAMLAIDGTPMIARMVRRVLPIVDEIIIAARDRVQGEYIAEAISNDLTVVYDPVTGYGPVAGIFAGMQASRSEYSVCLACDLPHINPDVIDAIFACAEDNDGDAAIPVHRNGMFEALHAVYGRPMIRACQSAMENRDRTVRSAISHLKRAVFVSTESLRRFDPDLRTFLNVNHPEDLGVIA